MIVPVTVIDPDNGQNILVTWVAPYDNSDAIIAYEIVFRSELDGLYVQVSECVSVYPDLVISCSIPIETFIDDTTFNLAYNDLVKVRARARNTNEWGDYSETNTDGARIQTKPIQMNQVTRGAETSTLQIQAVWIALTGHETGGSDIDSYHLQWDQSTNEATWYDLIGEEGNYFLDTSIIFTADVLPGDSYKVRVRAHNIHGWGEYSDPAIILSTGTPDKPNSPATIINNLNI